MARDKTDKTDKTPVATLATTATRGAKRYNRGEDGTNPMDKSFSHQPGGVVEDIGGDELQRVKGTWTEDLPLMGRDDFWHALEETLAECDAVMLRHGWDRKAGNGRNFPGVRTAEPFSELFYAGLIGESCWNFLTYHRLNDPNPVMLAQAVELGRLSADYEWRRHYKPSILTGRKQRKTLADHRGRANEKQREGVLVRREAIVTLLRETNRNLTGGALGRFLCKRLMDRFGIKASLRTIRRDLSQIL